MKIATSIMRISICGLIKQRHDPEPGSRIHCPEDVRVVPGRLSYPVPASKPSAGGTAKSCCAYRYINPGAASNGRSGREPLRPFPCQPRRAQEITVLAP